ncbi:MAG: M14 family zinc carboxypeptidase [Planctomycetota bacterium]
MSSNEAIKALLLIVCVIFSLGAAAPPDHTLARVFLATRADLETLQLQGFDLVARESGDPGGGGFGSVDLVVLRADLDRLNRLGFRVRILEENLEQRTAERLGSPPMASSMAPPNFGAGSQGGYYSLAEIEALLDHYSMTYPAIVSAKQVIGTSVEGRPIHALRISDNPNLAEGEPKILLDALHHAREPMSVQTLLFLLHQLAVGYGGDPLITSLVNEREIWMVPVVNPDGYFFNETTFPGGGGLWRKNRQSFGGCHGVDLNRNYSTYFAFDDYGSSNDPCAETYRGPAALSEPETAALDSLAARERFEMVVSLHAHGALLLHPLGYLDQPAQNVALYRERGEELAALNGYLPGAVSDLLATVNGNALDHHDLTYGSETWAFEVGKSFWPPLSEMLPVAQENLEPLLLLIRYAGAYLVQNGLEISDGSGNGNGFADPGEVVDLLLSVRNRGQAGTSGQATVTLGCADPNLSLLSSTATLASIGALAEASTGPGGIRVAVSPGASPGDRIPITVTLDWDGFSVVSELILRVGTLRPIAVDDLESDLGWAAGLPGDDALTGEWERSDPIQILHYQNEAQPEDDTTPSPGTHCYVTGNGGTAPGQDDVDDGTTTLVTPTFSLADTREPVLRYNRFYWCSNGQNPLTIDVSNDDGATWVNLETVALRPNAWVQREWWLADCLAPTARMKIRFIATDPQNSSVTEALIDDLELLDFGLTPHVMIFGKPAISGRVEIQLAARPGTPVLLFLSLGTGSTRLGGVRGTFGLDLLTQRIILNSAVPGSGLLRTALPIPNNPPLVGLQVFLQSLALEATPVLSNVVELTVVNP